MAPSTELTVRRGLAYSLRLLSLIRSDQNLSFQQCMSLYLPGTFPHALSSVSCILPHPGYASHNKSVNLARHYFRQDTAGLQEMPQNLPVRFDLTIAVRHRRPQG